MSTVSIETTPKSKRGGQKGRRPIEVGFAPEA